MATAVGNAVLDVVLAPGFIDHIAEMGLLLKQRLGEFKDRHPSVVAEIRGEGLMIGLGLHPPVNDFVAAARAEKLLLIPAGDNVARLLPPLIIGEAEIGEAMKRLEAAAQRIEHDLAAKHKGAAE